MFRGGYFIQVRPLFASSVTRGRVPLPFLAGILLLGFLAYPVPSRAEIRVVTGIGEHRMSDRETKADAVRLATEQAKKHALEQVASYLESVTVVHDLDVTQDEIRSYTAGIVSVQEQQVKTELDDDVLTIRVELTAQVDTDEVTHAIAALRENEDAREQLLALRQDVEKLQQELESANRALATAASPEQTRRLTARRNELLNRAESDAMVAQAWTDWVLLAPLMQPYPSAGQAQVQAWLGLAGRLSPGNPYLAVAQQSVGANSPPAPPQPPRPPVPHTVPFLPGYSVVPQQPDQSGASPDHSRQLSSVYQPKPFPPNPSGSQSPAGNTTTIIQVPAPPGSSSSSTGRGTMPTYRRVPPPNDQSTTDTLHTHRGGDQSPAVPRAVSPAIRYQVPQKPVSTPSPSSPTIPDKGTAQGGK